MSDGHVNKRTMPQLRFQVVRESPNLILCRVTGSITRNTLDACGEDTESKISDQLASGDLLLDLSQTQRVDSAGVSWLIRLHRRCEKMGGRLIIHSAGPVIFRTFDLLNMKTIFSIAENETSARELARLAPD